MTRMIHIKSARDIERMREAGRHVGEILLLLRQAVEPGMTTADFDRIARDEIRRRGLRSSFLGYAPGGAPPFAGVVCTSLNEEIVHGIPGKRRIREGDLLKLDFGAIFDGFHGDSAATVAVGSVDDASARLAETTLRSLYAGVAKMVPGSRLGDVGHAVQVAAEAGGYSVVRDFVGHGIGRSLHEPPQLPNFGKPGKGQRLRAGMVIAIEPMVNAGGAAVEMMDDGWTASTADRSLSAHFEHTVLITEEGPEVLTRVPGSH